MKKVAEQLREEWKVQAQCPNHKNNRWISTNLIRPFLFFTTRPLTLHQTLQHANVECMMTCFKLLLQSINSAGKPSLYYFLDLFEIYIVFCIL